MSAVLAEEVSPDRSQSKPSASFTVTEKALIAAAKAEDMQELHRLSNELFLGHGLEEVHELQRSALVAAAESDRVTATAFLLLGVDRQGLEKAFVAACAQNAVNALDYILERRGSDLGPWIRAFALIKSSPGTLAFERLAEAGITPNTLELETKVVTLLLEAAAQGWISDLMEWRPRIKDGCGPILSDAYRAAVQNDGKITTSKSNHRAAGTFLLQRIPQEEFERLAAFAASEGKAEFVFGMVSFLQQGSLATLPNEQLINPVARAAIESAAFADHLTTVQTLINFAPFKAIAPELLELALRAAIRGDRARVVEDASDTISRTEPTTVPWLASEIAAREGCSFILRAAVDLALTERDGLASQVIEAAGAEKCVGIHQIRTAVLYGNIAACLCLDDLPNAAIRAGLENVLPELIARYRRNSGKLDRSIYECISLLIGDGGDPHTGKDRIVDVHRALERYAGEEFAEKHRFNFASVLQKIIAANDSVSLSGFLPWLSTEQVNGVFCSVAGLDGAAEDQLDPQRLELLSTSAATGVITENHLKSVVPKLVSEGSNAANAAARRIFDNLSTSDMNYYLAEYGLSCDSATFASLQERGESLVGELYSAARSRDKSWFSVKLDAFPWQKPRYVLDASVIEKVTEYCEAHWPEGADLLRRKIGDNPVAIVMKNFFDS